MRPCFLVLDNEFPFSISSRKLVIETAKLNVITAYSSEEAIETLERFPLVNGVVINSELQGKSSCREVIDRLRAVKSEVPIITVSPSGQDRCGGEQFHVSSYDPKQLLDVLDAICPKDDGEAAQAGSDTNENPPLTTDP